MSDDLPSIFDEAGRRGEGGKRKKKKKKPSESEQQKEGVEMTPLEQSERTAPESVREMLDKIQKMHEELEEKLETVDNKSIYLPQHLKDILENPETVDQQYLKKMFEKKEEMEQKVVSIIGVHPSAIMGRKEDKKEKKRGQKSAKLRAKKNWMRME